MAEKQNDRRNPASQPDIPRNPAFPRTLSGTATGVARALEKGNLEAANVPALPLLAAQPPAKPESKMLTELRDEKQRLRVEIMAHERVMGQLDLDYLAVESKISWFERHPEAEEIFNFVDEVRKRLAG